MASTLNPYLTFQGTAREAMEFYRDVFGGELTLTTFADFGLADIPNPEYIMHAQLDTTAGYTLMASDPAPGVTMTPGSAITISVSGDDAEQLRGYWDSLAAGGTVTMALERQMWGDEFGMVTDRFGIDWMVNIAAPSADA
jgi:PhnB protein